MSEDRITTTSKSYWTTSRLIKFFSRVLMAIEARKLRLDITINVVRTADWQAHEDRLFYVRHLEHENAYLETMLKAVGIDPHESLSVARVREIEEKLKCQ
jgi:hypothetical protein